MTQSHDGQLLQLLRLVFTGTIYTLWMQRVTSLGAPAQASLIISICKYFGQCLAVFLGQKPASNAISPEALKLAQSYLFAISFLDVLGTIVFTIALSSVGSGLFQVVSSFQLVSTAAISYVILGKVLTKGQKIGVSVITVGMAMTAQPGNVDFSDPKQLLGLALSFVYALIGSSTGVAAALMQLALKKKGFPELPSAFISGKIGLYSLVLNLAYFALYTVPRWEELVAGPIAQRGIDFATLVLVFCVYIAVAALHSLTYWSALTRMGAVMTGLANALRTVSVFFLSALFFCASNEAQCLSNRKVLSAFVVVSGVITFVLSQPPRVETAHREKTS